MALAEGCCSSVTPCWHQKRHPDGICETCRDARHLSLLSGNDRLALATTFEVENIFQSFHPGGDSQRRAKLQAAILRAIQTGAR